jgi:hypothetical protein
MLAIVAGKIFSACGIVKVPLSESTISSSGGIELEESLLMADAHLRKCHNIGVISGDAMILIHVSANGGCTIKHAQSHSPLSSRTFYTKMRWLINNGYLNLETNTGDRRKRSLTLAGKGEAYVDALNLILRDRPGR